MNEMKDFLTDLAACHDQEQLQRIATQIRDARIDGKISVEVSHAFSIIINELKAVL